MCQHQDKRNPSLPISRCRHRSIQTSVFDVRRIAFRSRPGGKFRHVYTQRHHHLACDTPHSLQYVSQALTNAANELLWYCGSPPLLRWQHIVDIILLLIGSRALPKPVSHQWWNQTSLPLGDQMSPSANVAIHPYFA